jgi:hypothetical protein
MDVQIQSSAEPLDDDHGSRTTVVDQVSPRAVAVEAEERTHVHAEHPEGATLSNAMISPSGKW